MARSDIRVIIEPLAIFGSGPYVSLRQLSTRFELMYISIEYKSVASGTPIRVGSQLYAKSWLQT